MYNESRHRLKNSPAKPSPGQARSVRRNANHAKETTQAPPPGKLPKPDNALTAALLEQWVREDATNDPALIHQAEEELLEFKRALNANRLSAIPLFP